MPSPWVAWALTYWVCMGYELEAHACSSRCWNIGAVDGDGQVRGAIHMGNHCDEDEMQEAHPPRLGPS